MPTNTTVTRVSLSRFVPRGSPKLSDFTVEQVPAPTKDQLQDGQVLLHPLYYSVDPYQRNRMGGVDTYVASYSVGEPITNSLVAKVVASANKGYAEGDLVLHHKGKWQSEYIANGEELHKAPASGGIEPRDYMGVLSMPAFTAYVGGVALAKPKKGETILVSSASGAVGQMVVQLSKARGLNVIGVASSGEKLDYVKSLGADAVINYTTCGSYTQAIKEAAPNGIDIYFDNVGGAFLDAALASIKDFARVIICGAITQYNVGSAEEIYGVKNIANILTRKASIQGFLVGDYYSTAVQQQFAAEVPELYRQGKIEYRTHEVEGIENAPQALLDLFASKNFGKSIVKAKEQ